MLDIFLKWAVPFACGGIITGFITYIRTVQRRNKALEDGVQCLLRAEIIRSNEKYTERHFCPVYAKEALTKAYTAYHALDGNDVATELYHAVIELPANETERKHE